MTRLCPWGLITFLALMLILSGTTGNSDAGQEKAGPPTVKMAVPSSPLPSTGALPEESSVGVKEIPRPDGGKDKVYFSVTPESDRRAREAAEQYKLEKSMDSLNNVIIFSR